MTFLIAGELSLPEELPEFPYEAEFIREIENAILKYGGREGVTLLKEHAIEQREVLESSMNQNLSAISIPIGTIHILRKHIFSPFWPPPYVSISYVPKIRKYGMLTKEGGPGERAKKG